MLTNLVSTITAGLLVATGAQAAQYATIQMWSNKDCTGTFHEETLVFDTGKGQKVFEYPYTWGSGKVVSGVSACGVSFCQYGSSCFGTEVAYVNWSPNCYSGGSWMAFDKIMVNTC
ncbi:uncharacterized protein BO97DRAFT_411921 [Aspergillus homomorphus CBS 101889]|uniref:Uncharacterized protein n=1 Tax=Aspergillus homomorphus (strain CBS 101889) TaxID=1450537 RepID=A0A395IAI8_ASPHC|nr:hypothetical protein BO97DRAFT_411921 [Aspergillus homomorphus CBS 101889]RAL15164.1 hypothetical protein BO97DRAFT_411921 [Aspergillus homomorphus CBS 101889]